MWTSAKLTKIYIGYGQYEMNNTKEAEQTLGVNAYLISTTLELFLTCIDWIWSYVVLVAQLCHCKLHWKWTHNNHANTTHIIVCFPFSSLKMPYSLPLVKRNIWISRWNIIHFIWLYLFFMQRIKNFFQYSQMPGFHFSDQFLTTLGNWIDLFNMTWLIFWLKGSSPPTKFIAILWGGIFLKSNLAVHIRWHSRTFCLDTACWMYIVGSCNKWYELNDLWSSLISSSMRKPIK